MANIKLGAIITDIAGSVGGSTFRRTPAGIILYNKQGTQIKSAFAKNSVKNKLGAVITSWTNLDKTDKGFWIDKATLYTFPDKFGNLKYLTGRQLYIKLNTQFIPANDVLSITPWYDTKPGQVVVDVKCDVGVEEFIIEFDNQVDDLFMLVQVTPTTRGANPKPRKKAFNTYAKLVAGSNIYNIWGGFFQQFPLVEAKQFYNVNIILMTPSGFQSSVQSFVIETTT